MVPSVVAQSGDQEGLGLVVVEAMGCGCAVVVSDVPAIRDIVSHGVNGVVFPAGDSGALAVALDQMRSDVALRQRLATSGRLAVLEQFDWSTAVHRYKVLYRQLEVN